jgi:branched-chain amino acid transport system permease protein
VTTASGTGDFLQLSISGIALGCLYALVALGFVLVLRSSGVLNLFQGGFILVSAYLTYEAHVRWQLPFAVAVLVGVLAVVAMGLLVETFLIRRIARRSPLSVILVTIGLLLVTESIVASIWGYEPLSMKDPWGLSKAHLGSATVSQLDLWVIGLTAVLLTAFFLYFKFSLVGVAMRAAGEDPEAAIAQGISPRLILSVAWGISAVIGALTGIALGSAAHGGVQVSLDQVALAALPAVIVGGLYSASGAVVGGLVVGLAQLYAAGYAPTWLGSGFSTVMPYLVMTVMLIIRPHGLFGRQLVRRA